MLFELEITRIPKVYTSVTRLTVTLAKSLDAHQGEMNIISP